MDAVHAEAITALLRRGALAGADAGPSLADVRRARVPLSDAEAATVAIPVAEALDALHAAGLAYGPPGPGDIRFLPGGRPALVVPPRFADEPDDDVPGLLRTVLGVMTPPLGDDDAADDEPDLRPVLETLLAGGCRSGAEVVRACFATVEPEPIRIPDAGTLARASLVRPVALRLPRGDAKGLPARGAFGPADGSTRGLRVGPTQLARAARGLLGPADRSTRRPTAVSLGERTARGLGRQAGARQLWMSDRTARGLDREAEARRLSSMSERTGRGLGRPFEPRRLTSPAGATDAAVEPGPSRRAARQRGRRRARLRTGAVVAVAIALVGGVLLRPSTGRVDAGQVRSPAGVAVDPVLDRSAPAAAAAGLTRQRSAVIGAGDAAGLDAVDAAGGSALNADEDLLASLNGDRLEGLSVDVQATNLVDRPGQDEATVAVMSAMSPYRRVGESGPVAVPGTAPRTVVLHLRWTPAGWRVWSVEEPAATP